MTTEERGEPSLIYVRRGNSSMPIELVVVEKNLTMVWIFPEASKLQMIAALASFLHTVPKGTP
jgi:hypothetical protein